MGKVVLSLLLFALTEVAFAAREGRTFETRGMAVIFTSSTFTVGIEKRDIPIPQYLDVDIDPGWRGLSHDSSSASWTKCRLPLKSEMTWQGTKERSLVFDCRPLSFYR